MTIPRGLYMALVQKNPGYLLKYFSEYYLHINHGASYKKEALIITLSTTIIPLDNIQYGS